eukprot:TRINITY_DN7084_c0_g1_i4.p1 TRINITY_DN7084_c0_g1~~TRINITY_DN7084_c0_g1_i4.p1  ORF type:complete len:335 (+),score=97.56 TRINITY_DN7084_c0_g1_i4:113-1117(+)
MSFADSRGGGGRSYQAGGYGSSTAGGTGGYSSPSPAPTPYYNGNSNNDGGANNSGRSIGGGGGARSGATLGGGGGMVAEENAEHIKDQIKILSTNVNGIQKMSSTLGTPKDNQETRHQLQHLIETTKSLIKDITNNIKTLNTTSRSNPEVRPLVGKLSKDFQVLVDRYQDVSKAALQKERSTPIPPPKSMSSNQGLMGSPNTFPQAYDPAEDERQGLIEGAKRQQLMQLENERQFNDNLIQEREDDLKKIEAAIVDVNMIMTDLSALVADQQIMIDNIEDQIESTVDHTTSGVQELRKASEHQKSARSKMCWLLLIVVIVAAVLAGVLVFTLKK